MIVPANAALCGSSDIYLVVGQPKCRNMEDKVKLTLVKATLKCVSVSICLYLLLVQSVSAQENPTVNQAVSRNIAAGTTDKYSISLNDGDYVATSIRQHGTVNMIVLNPDGSVMRRLLGPKGDAKNAFPFAAEGAGLYSINIVNPGKQAASYELLLQKIVSLNERFRPEAWSDPNP